MLFRSSFLPFPGGGGRCLRDPNSPGYRRNFLFRHRSSLGTPRERARTGTLVDEEGGPPGSEPLAPVCHSGHTPGFPFLFSCARLSLRTDGALKGSIPCPDYDLSTGTDSRPRVPFVGRVRPDQDSPAESTPVLTARVRLARATEGGGNCSSSSAIDAGATACETTRGMRL